FQAEDGIRDKLVTGVQTCALPIYVDESGLAFQIGETPGAAGEILRLEIGERRGVLDLRWRHGVGLGAGGGPPGPGFGRASVRERSEERRVGKECWCVWAADQCRKI